MKEDFMLTTVDNPFNPFTQYESWFIYDVTHNYNTCAYLARVARTSESLSDSENEQEIYEAMQEIVANDLAGIYKIVSNKDFGAKNSEESK